MSLLRRPEISIVENEIISGRLEGLVAIFCCIKRPRSDESGIAVQFSLSVPIYIAVLYTQRSICTNKRFIESTYILLLKLNSCIQFDRVTV